MAASGRISRLWLAILAWPLPWIAAAQARRGRRLCTRSGVGQRPLRSQDPDEDAEEEIVVQLASQAFVMNDDQFDQWVFGAPRNSRAGRNKLDSLLTLEVDEVAQSVQPVGACRRRSWCWPDGAISSGSSSKVEEKRKKFDKVKTDQNKVSEIYQELVPLQATLHSGLFNDGSFYAKTLKTVLSGSEAPVPGGCAGEESASAIAPRSSWSSPSSTSPSDFATPSGGKLVELILSETQPPERLRTVRLLPRAVPGWQDPRGQAQAALRGQAVGLSAAPAEPGTRHGAVPPHPGFASRQGARPGDRRRVSRRPCASRSRGRTTFPPTCSRRRRVNKQPSTQDRADQEGTTKTDSRDRWTPRALAATVDRRCDRPRSWLCPSACRPGPRRSFPARSSARSSPATFARCTIAACSTWPRSRARRATGPAAATRTAPGRSAWA